MSALSLLGEIQETQKEEKSAKEGNSQGTVDNSLENK